jgi:hypothetical protein
MLPPRFLRAILLLVLGLFLLRVACTYQKRCRALSWQEQARVLERLRARLLRSPALQRDHPEACDVLSRWRLAPDATEARVDPAARTIRVVVTDSKGQPYDAETLLLVILHEVAHATSPTLAHDEAWARQHAALLRAAEEDGLLQLGQEPDWTYPARILHGGSSARFL